MEIFIGILAVGFVLVFISCFGWILKGLSVVGKFGLGCFFKGLLYAFCAYIILMVLITLIGFI